MKLVAKCSAFVSHFYQVHVKVYNPIPLNIQNGGSKLTILNSLNAHNFPIYH